jgi:hypothetical protein
LRLGDRYVSEASLRATVSSRLCAITHESENIALKTGMPEICGQLLKVLSIYYVMYRTDDLFESA